MSTLTVGWLVDLVEKKAQDEENADFSQAELIGLYNMTLRTIVSLVPRAYTIEIILKLAAGISQGIPADGISLVDVSMNMGTDGETPGTTITEADLDVLSRLVPEWTTETAAVEIDQFMRRPGMDASFFVVPPSDGTGYIRVNYVATPPTTSYDASGDWESNKIPLSDEYVAALPDGMLYNAYDDDTDTPGNEGRSQKYYNRMLQFLGIKGEQTAGRK